MTTDLRELLREVRAELAATLDIQISPELKLLIERIDAALSEPAPEPATEVLSGEGSLYIPRYSIPVGTKLYAAPPPASPSDARDAEIEAFKTDATNLQRELDCLIPVLKESISWLMDLSTRWSDHENWSYARACATRAEALLAKKPD